MTLGDFSRDFETVIREVSCSYFCNISSVDCRLTSKEGAEATFSVYGYGNGICEVDEIHKYLRQCFNQLGYTVKSPYTPSMFSNSMLPITGYFTIKVNFSRKFIWIYCSYSY